MIIRIKKIYIKIFIILLIVSGAFLFFKNTNYISLAKSINLYSSEIKELSPNYLNYSEDSLEYSKRRGDTLLFFAATDWCNTCSALDEEIINNSGDLPDDLTILKINYDNDKNTNKKYFVTMQHTLVLIDSDGNEKTRWVGGDFENLINNLKN